MTIISEIKLRELIRSQINEGVWDSIKNAIGLGEKNIDIKQAIKDIKKFDNTIEAVGFKYLDDVDKEIIFEKFPKFKNLVQFDSSEVDKLPFVKALTNGEDDEDRLKVLFKQTENKELVLKFLSIISSVDISEMINFIQSSKIKNRIEKAKSQEDSDRGKNKEKNDAWNKRRDDEEKAYRKKYNDSQDVIAKEKDAEEREWEREQKKRKEKERNKRMGLE